jgi:hypothetical protein
LLHSPQIPVKAISLLFIERRGIKCWTRNRHARSRRDGRKPWHCVGYGFECLRKRVRNKRGSIRGEKRQKEFAVKRVLLQVNEQMP